MHIHTVTYIHIYIYIYTHVYINGLAWSACRSAPVIHGVQVAQVSGETSNEVYLQQWMQAMTRRFGALTRSSLDRRTTPSWSRGDRGCFLCVCVGPCAMYHSQAMDSWRVHGFWIVLPNFPSLEPGFSRHDQKICIN